MKTGAKHTQETLGKMRLSHLGLKHTPEAREKIRIALTGKPKTEQARKNMSKAQSVPHPWNVGRKNFPEAIQKMSASRKAFCDKTERQRDGVRVTRGRYSYGSVPGHPFSPASKPGKVQLNRLAAEETVGRYLLPNEVAHHIDLDTRNNEPSNIVVMGRGEHTRYHQNLNSLFEHWLGA